MTPILVWWILGLWVYGAAAMYYWLQADSGRYTDAIEEPGATPGLVGSRDECRRLIEESAFLSTDEFMGQLREMRRARWHPDNLHPCPACGKLYPRQSRACPRCAMTRDGRTEESIDTPAAGFPHTRRPATSLSTLASVDHSTGLMPTVDTRDGT